MDAELNRLFPTAESLESLEKTSHYARLCQTILQLQLRQQLANTKELEAAHAAAREAPSKLKNTLEALREMQTLGEQTKSDVHQMTADIKRLDRTKDNLLHSVTVLKRLQMLKKVYSLLDVLLAEKRYSEMAQTVAAAAELVECFRPFRTLPQVASLLNEISKTSGHITSQVLDDLKKATQVGDPSGGQLPDACRAIDALQGRQQLLEWYTTQMLADYKRVFAPNDEAGSLDNIARRYASLKRLLELHQKEHASFFPKDWNVCLELARAAVNHTRSDLETLAASFKQLSRSPDAIQLLLTSLQASLEFEQYLARKLATKELGGSLSGTFTPYLALLVEFHDEQLTKLMAQYRGPQRTQNEESDVVPSCIDLFIYYRTALAQMAKLVTGEPLFLLSRVFARQLLQYASTVLKPMIPVASPEYGKENLEQVSKIIKTADYCMTTSDQLEQVIRDQLQPELSDKVDFDLQHQSFLDIVHGCLDFLVEYVSAQLDPSWREFAAMGWGTLQQVGDQSAYVSHLCSTLKQATREALASLTKFSYCRLVADRIVESTTFALVSAAFRARPVPEVAAEQMLLDLYVLKGTLFELLALAPMDSDRKDRLASYKEATSRNVAKVEAIFKVLLTRPTPPETLVQKYLFLVHDSSVSNFRKILEVKGVRNQSRLVDHFRQLAGEDDSLELESALLAQISMSRHPPPRAPGSPAPENDVTGVFKLNNNLKRIGEFLRREAPLSPR